MGYWLFTPATVLLLSSLALLDFKTYGIFLSCRLLTSLLCKNKQSKCKLGGMLFNVLYIFNKTALFNSIKS